MQAARACPGLERSASDPMGTATHRGGPASTDGTNDAAPRGADGKHAGLGGEAIRAARRHCAADLDTNAVTR